MPNPPAFTALQTPFLDQKTGMVSWTWLQQIRQWQKQLAGGFDQSGNLIGSISATVQVVGHTGTLGAILQNIDQAGVVQPGGIPAATAAAQGAVILPAGATGNTLGSAALESSANFDAAGAATAAQNAAQAYTDKAATAAQGNAEAFAANASNLTSGFIATRLLQGESATVTLAALTTGGTQGSITFTNGLLTAYTPAT